MFDTVYNYQKGPATNSLKKECLDEFWTLINIPQDIPSKTALNHVRNFLTNVVAIEIPSSLMCNANCVYCYIREKWLKNTHVLIDDVAKIVNAGFEHIISFNNTTDEKVISSWGAEPFCNLDTLEYLLNFCKQHNIYLTLSTNATVVNDRVRNMLYEFYKHCLANNIKIEPLQISLDGPKHVQDTYRPLYNEESNFDKVEQFINMLDQIAFELKINKRLYHFCSTMYLDNNSLNVYKDSIEFYINNFNTRYYTNIVPIRIENSKNFTKADEDLFYELTKMCTDLLIEKSYKDNVGYLDWYASKLFLDTCRIDGCTRCSAMRTQVAIDLDGSMYMCHGPITNTKIKPFHWFGNVLDGIIDYRKYVSVTDRVYSDISFKALCKTCNLLTETTGLLCMSCPPIGDAINEDPVNFNIHVCNMYKRCFPLWKKQYEVFCQIENKLTTLCKSNADRLLAMDYSLIPNAVSASKLSCFGLCELEDAWLNDIDYKKVVSNC